MTTPKTTTSLKTFKESLLSIKDLGLEDQVKAVQFLEKRIEESRTLAGEKCEELKRALNIQSENNNEPVEKKQKLDIDKELNEENGNVIPPSEGKSVPSPRGSVLSKSSTTQSLKGVSYVQHFEPFSFGGTLDGVGGTSRAASHAGAVVSFPAPLESGSIGSCGAFLTKSGESLKSIAKEVKRTSAGGTHQSLQAPTNPISLFGVTSKTGSVGFSGLGGISTRLRGGLLNFGFRKPDVVALPLRCSEMELRPTHVTSSESVNGTEDDEKVSYQCITTMKEYKNTSLEELRFQDYAAGKKGRIDEVTQMKNKVFEKQKMTRELLGCNQVLHEFHDLRDAGKSQKLLEILKAPNRDCKKQTLIFVKDEAYRAYSVAKVLKDEKLTGFQNATTLLDINFSFTKEHPILVVTDEIARGHHIAGVADVINYDLPDTCAVFLERTGRVDKVSQMWGRVASFCEPGSADLTEELVKMMTDVGGKVPRWMGSG